MTYRRKILGTLAAALCTMATSAPTGVAHAKPDRAPPLSTPTATIKAFAAGAARQDVALLGRALHPDSVQFIGTDKGTQTLGRKAYLDLVRAGKAGGLPLDVTIETLSRHGKTVMAVARFASRAYTLTHHLSLIENRAGGWAIISSVVDFKPKS